MACKFGNRFSLNSILDRYPDLKSIIPSLEKDCERAEKEMVEGDIVTDHSVCLKSCLVKGSIIARGLVNLNDTEVLGNVIAVKLESISDRYKSYVVRGTVMTLFGSEFEERIELDISE